MSFQQKPCEFFYEAKQLGGPRSWEVEITRRVSLEDFVRMHAGVGVYLAVSADDVEKFRMLCCLVDSNKGGNGTYYWIDIDDGMSIFDDSGLVQSFSSVEDAVDFINELEPTTVFYVPGMVVTSWPLLRELRERSVDRTR